MSDDVLLEARHLSKHFHLGGRFTAGGRRTLRAVDDVSLTVRRGETLGLVGESGCGKSTLGRCLLRLYDPSSGTVLFEGTDITQASTRDLRALRPRMQMVFQDPYASLNPRRRVGQLVAEPLRVHPGPDGKNRSDAAIRDRLHELMDLVGLSREHLDRFPHEFSGGQRQRIGIARALALEPSLIVADESVSALDVSVQAQVVNLFMDLQDRLGITYVFIAHDLSVIRQVSQRTAVMYLGALVETGPTDVVFQTPAHPYTGALISAVPQADVRAPRREKIILRGDVPSPMNPPSGCRFHTRCPKAEDRCRVEPPPLRPMGHDRYAACHFPLI
ncbi:ABC transporter ATP-binding protein [Lichenihabitans psoromatis]|uniref:ABC transporter ATP-binding protein n=1 Tax=Lichenihabitans psoromatis TaxID=2528642 RepID=UPI001036C643|nr:ABC transporter ATP-binding protein [Lichenihabitans psoromatis]